MNATAGVASYKGFLGRNTEFEELGLEHSKSELFKLLFNERLCHFITKLEVSYLLPYPDGSHMVGICATACCCIAVPDEVWHTSELVTLLPF